MGQGGAPTVGEAGEELGEAHGLPVLLQIALHHHVVQGGVEGRAHEERVAVAQVVDADARDEIVLDAPVRELHQGADLYLSTARLEAFGIAALEAHTAGLPVVAPRGTGVEDFVTPGVDGLLEPSDVAVARAVARLAADPAERERMRVHLRAAPAQQDWHSVVRSTLAEYRRAGAPG